MDTDKLAIYWNRLVLVCKLSTACN